VCVFCIVRPQIFQDLQAAADSVHSGALRGAGGGGTIDKHRT
jgi:hypothetical protein